MSDEEVIRRITKVRYNGDRTSINYQVERGERIDEYTLSCTDQPVLEFKEALQSLRPTLPMWLEAPEQWFDTVKVLGVSFSWKNGIMGAVVMAGKALRHCNSPMVINAPHKTEHPYSGDDYGNCLSPEQVDALKAVLAETELYVDGTRAQMALALSEAV